MVNFTGEILISHLLDSIQMSDFIKVSSRTATVFQGLAKRSELSFVIRKTFLLMFNSCSQLVNFSVPAFTEVSEYKSRAQHFNHWSFQCNQSFSLGTNFTCFSMVCH